MTTSDEVRALWARTKIVCWPEEYVLASLDPVHLAEAAAAVGRSAGRFAAIVVERDEVSVTLERGAWLELSTRVPAAAVAGPYRAITLDLAIDLGVCGYLLPAAERLARAGVSIIPQCAYLKDHLLVRAADAERAVAVLQQLSDGGL
jgi:hypothetical protein